MRTKKYMKMYRKNSFLVVTEKIKNDINGNPKYSVSIFDKDTLYFRGNWNIVTYDVESCIEGLLKNIK